MDDNDQSDIIRKVKTSGAEAEGDDESGDEGDLDFGDEESTDEPTDSGDELDFGDDSNDGDIEETDTLLDEYDGVEVRQGSPFRDDELEDDGVTNDPNTAISDKDDYSRQIDKGEIEQDFQWESDDNFTNDEDNWGTSKSMWENKIQEGLSKLKKSSTFVIKEDMNEPQVQPDTETEVEVEPQRPSRKKRTWSPNIDEPNVNPEIDPKAASSIDSMDSDGGIINDEIVEI